MTTAIRNRCWSRRIACTALAMACAAAASARTFTWEFERTGGRATQVFDAIGPLFTFFATPTAYQNELLGEVTIETVSFIAPGNAASQGGFFDTEIFFYGSYDQTLPAGQRSRQVTIPPQNFSGARWQFVTRFVDAGDQRFDAQFDFETESGSATPFLHLVKKAENGPLMTDPFGLGAQVRVWTAAAPTDLTIERFAFTVTGRIVRYQITPFISDGALEIEKDDDAYNNREFFNGGSVRIVDRLTNRGVFNNAGTVTIEEAQHLTELVNRGSFALLSGSMVTNTGRLVNESGGRIAGDGTIDNRASFPGELSPEDPSLPPSRNPGLFNRGELVLSPGGRLVNNQGAAFENTGSFQIDPDAVFDNAADFRNGSPDARRALLVNEGTIDHQAGTITNHGRIESHGRFLNAATIDNRGDLDVLYQRGGALTSELVNRGLLRNGQDNGEDLPDAVRLRVESMLVNEGVLDNRGTLEVLGELHNRGRLLNGERNPTERVKLTVRGSFVQASDAELVNEGALLVAGGTFENAGTVINRGELAIFGDGVIGGAHGSFVGGTVNNTGTLEIDTAGAMQLLNYSQSGAGAVTLVNGPLEAHSVDIQGGSLLGRDRVSATSIVIGPSATVRPGTSPGTLTLAGTVVIYGVLELELSPEGSDRLDVIGTLVFGPGAQVRFAFVDGLLPEPGQRYALTDHVSATDGLFGLESAAFGVTGLPQQWAATWDGSGFAVAAVPEPRVVAMLLAGLLVVVGARARRQWLPAG